MGDKKECNPSKVFIFLLFFFLHNIKHTTVNTINKLHPHLHITPKTTQSKSTISQVRFYKDILRSVKLIKFSFKQVNSDQKDKLHQKLDINTIRRSATLLK